MKISILTFKYFLFILLVGIGSISLIDSTIRFISGEKLMYPIHKVTKWQLSPSALVYDKYVGFFTKLNIEVITNKRRYTLDTSYDRKIEYVRRHIVHAGQRYWNNPLSNYLFKYFICRQKLESIKHFIETDEHIIEADVELIALEVDQSFGHKKIICN